MIGKGCGEYVEEQRGNGIIGFVCGDVYKGVYPLCAKCSSPKENSEEKK